MVLLTLMQRMGNAYSLRLRFFIIASIIFENANDDAKCEWAFRRLNGDNFERQHPQPRLVEIDIHKLSGERCICSVEISQVVLGKVQVKASVACLPSFCH